MYYPPFLFAFWYVKKEDAKSIVKKLSIYSWIIALCLGVVLVVLNFLVYPRLESMYQDFGYTMPLYAHWIVRLVVFLVGVGAIFSLKPVSEQSLNEKLKKYKPGEMILVSQLLNFGYELSVVGILFFVIVAMVLTIVLPIYNLTAKM